MEFLIRYLLWLGCSITLAAVTFRGYREGDPEWALGFYAVMTAMSVHNMHALADKPWRKDRQ
jgi:hypothetical protein